MKISGKFILKVAGTLTAISLVVAALLGFVNSITKDKIAAIDAENTRVAMSAVAPEGSEFGDKMELSEAAITAAKSAYDALSDEDKTLVDADKVAALNAAIIKLNRLKHADLMANQDHRRLHPGPGHPHGELHRRRVDDHRPGPQRPPRARRVL